MTTEDHHDLMKKIAKGDQIAFRHLADALSGRMFALAYRLMGNDRASAEDAVQDALIKWWVAATNWKPIGKVESYVLTIVHRCCMDLYRKQRPQCEIPETLADGSQGIEKTLEIQEMRQTVLSHIDRLPDRQRTAILMSYFEESSNRQIATTLAVSEQAVESLLVRARRTLGQTLKNLDQFLPSASNEKKSS